ncbi:Formin-like protein, partial [Thalictrum thalictroides]
MLSALAFFLYRHRAHHSTESQKLVSATTTSNGNVQRFLNESSAPPPGSDLLYLGTIEPSSRRSGGSDSGGGGGGNDSNTNGSPSPYHKLNSLRNSEFYRPSPELHPLPPLRRTTTTTTTTTQAQTENSTSPLRTNSSSMNSSEDLFYSPNDSATGNGETPYSPVPKQIFSNSSNSVSSIKNVIHTTSSPNPHSRRSSPKSRLSFSTPDVKQVIVPASPSPPLPSLDPQCQNSQPRTPSPPQRKSKFTSPPSPSSLNMGLPRSVVHESSLQPTKIPIPPPLPPPLPPPPSMASRKDISQVTNVSTKLVQVLPRSLPMMPTPTRPTGAEVPEVIPDCSSSEPHRDVEDDDGAKPKLKPLHWDKVRATSDRAMVWDQLKSSSFHLNEDMIETLFGCNSKNSAKKESPRTSVLPPVEKENRVLDPKKSQNIAILLRALNVTRDEVSEALLEGNPDGLGTELLETL